jgi:hypothetical protein
VTYKISYNAAAGVETMAWYPLLPTTGQKRLKGLTEMKPTSLEVKATMPRDFTLKPGQSKTVS